MLIKIDKYIPETMLNIEKDIRFRSDLSSGEKLFYAEIKEMAKKGNPPFASKDLGKYFSVSQPTIVNWVKKMVNLDLMEVITDFKSGKFSQYLKVKDKNF